jgi:hypothetical protein
MPGYKGHIAGAIVVGGAYVGGMSIAAHDLLDKAGITLVDWQLLVGLFVIVVLFGLWPDVDTNSKGQNIFFGIAFIADILLIVTGRFEAAAYLGLLAMTPIVGRHRGWTHSKIAMLAVPLPILIVPYIYSQHLLPLCAVLYGAAVAGYFSHLLLDGLIVRAIHFKSER